MARASDVAKYILCLSEPDTGDFISNLKLQKLLYYSQGTHLALYGERLFDEPIEAWLHGPVVPLVYREFKTYGNNPIDMPEDFNKDLLTPDERDSVEEAYAEFGQYSAWKLRNMTHDEPPWKETGQNDIISIRAIMDYFSTLVVDG
jgi:uncharacterized phage-associated protein